MLNKKYLCVLVTVALFGCGSQEEAPTETNTEPTIQLEKTSVSLEEGAVLEVPFAALDKETSYESLQIAVDATGQPENSGIFEVNKAEKKFIYKAPWLTNSVKSIDTGAQLVVTDSAGNKKSARLSVKVLDKTDVVKLRVTPPAQSFGFEKTQTENRLNLFVMESQPNVVVQYSTTENDADDLTIDYSVTQNKYVFKNDITPSSKDKGFDLSLNLPNIDEPSVQFTLNASAKDNDGISENIVSITVINDVKLQWAAGNSEFISEKDGAQLKFVSSEKNTYPSTVTVSITDLNGKPLQDDVPYTLNKSTQTITFGTQPPIVGDVTRLVTLTVSNEIKNAVGEVYVAKSTLSAPFLFKDDRDNSFEEQLNVFNKQVSWLENMGVRADESRLGAVVAKHLFLKNLIDDVQANEIHNRSEELFEANIVQLKDLVRITRDVIASGSPQEKKDAMDKFSAEFKNIGKPVRELLGSKINELIESQGAARVQLKPVFGSAVFTEINSGAMLSHYVGNYEYGQYLDPQKKDWGYFPGYEYLDVVDITNSYCFN